MADTIDVQDDAKTVDASSSPAEGVDQGVDGGTDVTDTHEAKYQDPAREFHRRRAMSRSVIAAFSLASAVVATLPLPLKDAVMLSPIEMAEINALASIYDIPQEESIHKVLDAMVQLGLVSMAARGAISVIDQGLRLTVAAKFKSASIAAGIVAAVGLCSTYAFEQVYQGKRSLDDLGVMRKVRESEVWKRVTQAVSGKAHEVMEEDTLDGLRVFANEMGKVVNPMASEA